MNTNMNMNMNMNIKARNETIEKFCYGTSVTEPNNMNYKQKWKRKRSPTQCSQNNSPIPQGYIY